MLNIENKTDDFVLKTIEKYQTPLIEKNGGLLVSIDWNKVDMKVENDMYQLCKTQFWVPNKFPVGKDLPSIKKLNIDEVYTTMKNYQTLALFDTIQSTLGIYKVMGVTNNPKSKAVLAAFDNIEFIHDESYPYIFSTLLSSQYEAKLRRWELESPHLKAFQLIVRSFYENSDNDPLLIKIGSVILEGILFYSGFFLPLYWESRGIMTQTAELIRTIVRDEQGHVTYISLLYRRELSALPEEKKAFYYTKLMELFVDLYPVILDYNKHIYDVLGLTENANKFVNYNVNRTFGLLGYPTIIPSIEANVDEVILSALTNKANSSHNFFSQPGSNYVILKDELTTDDDYSGVNF